MIIFLYGEDTYRLAENRESVIRSYQVKHGSGFNFFRFDGAHPDAAAQVGEAVKSVSLFSEVKLVLVNNIFSNLATASKVQDILTTYKIPSDPGIVILATHAGSAAQAKPKELFSLLADAKNLVRDFSHLEGPKLQAWLKKEATARETSFESGALARFISTAGHDSWSRVHNLEKLANYCRGTISSAAVDLLVKTDQTEPNVFEFIDALGSGHKTQAFSLLCGELAYGRDPYYLLSMVMYQFRNMLIVKDLASRNISEAQIAKKAGMHPFVVKKMLSATSRIPLPEIQSLYQEVLDLEQGTKQGRRDLEDGLFSLALQTTV